MNLLDRLVQNPLGAVAVLGLAAFLEAYGDSFFQVSFYRSSAWAGVDVCRRRRGADGVRLGGERAALGLRKLLACTWCCSS